MKAAQSEINYAERAGGEEKNAERGICKVTSDGGRRLHAGAKTVSDELPLKVAAIKAKEALMKRIYNRTCLDILRSGGPISLLPFAA